MWKKLSIVIGICTVVMFGGVFADDDLIVSARETIKNTYIAQTSEDLYIGDLAEILSHAPIKNSKSVIQNFCVTLLINDHYLLYDDFMYSPSQSFFVFVMCSNIAEDLTFAFPYLLNTETKYLNKYRFKDFQLPSLNCSATGTLNNCNMGNYAPQIFNEIANEFFVVKQADVYGLSTDKMTEEEWATDDQQANAFTQRELYGEFLCDKEGKKDNECYYPKTLRKVKNYQNKVKKLFKKLKIVNYSAIFADSKKYVGEGKDALAGECSEASKWDGTYNIVMCGLYWEKEHSMNAFLNIMYNEMFYYRLFMKYYTASLDTHPQKMVTGRQINRILTKKEKYKQTALQEVFWSEQAVHLALDMLYEMYQTYPLHIGFLMYQEDLLGFREELAKVVTPMYTLYDKLRKAQEPAK